jgi:hypothetical protein
LFLTKNLVAENMLRRFDSNASRANKRRREEAAARALANGTQTLLCHGSVNAGHGSNSFLTHTGYRAPGDLNRLHVPQVSSGETYNINFAGAVMHGNTVLSVGKSNKSLSHATSEATITNTSTTALLSPEKKGKGKVVDLCSPDARDQQRLEYVNKRVESDPELAAAISNFVASREGKPTGARPSYTEEEKTYAANCVSIMMKNDESGEGALSKCQSVATFKAAVGHLSPAASAITTWTDTALRGDPLGDARMINHHFEKEVLNRLVA